MNFQFANDVFGNNPWICLGLFFILGACVGSFLNVLALRSLKEESIIWPPSYCPKCNHRLSPFDNIPVISWLLLQGKCRYCKQPIHWQYPLVEILTGLIFTAVAFEFLVCQISVPKNAFELSINNALQGRPMAIDSWLNAVFQGSTRDLFSLIHEAHGPADVVELIPLPDFLKIGLAVDFFIFSSVLVAVCITDFREKLIPHEITYPAMIVGIFFSTFIRGDFFGTMTGIGASYIIFDFMAFYGLKVYMATHPQSDNTDTAEGESAATEGQPKLAFEPGLPVDVSVESTAAGGQEPKTAGGGQETLPNQEISTENTQLSATDNKGINATKSDTENQQSDTEPVEVMGGGDAVLSAVMAAYLGWRLLIVALVIGFMVGTMHGIGLLIYEMRKANLLKDCFFNAAKWGVILFTIFAGLTTFMYCSVGGMTFANAMQPALSTGLLGGIGGALLGTVMIGKQVSKPFPFGPALAAGGFIAMFFIPYWLAFY